MPPLVEPIDVLSDEDRARTARHLSLVGFGEIGQRRLAAAHVAVVGAGGLGSPVVLALAAAGVGTLTVIDDDMVELSNLQRQVIHRRGDVGTRKVDSAVRVAADLSDTRVLAVADRLTPGNAVELLADADLVIDGSDLFETRAAVASATENLGIPLIWGTVQEFDAQVTVFWNRPPAGHAAVVLRDLHPPESVGVVPSCAAVGVLGALCLQVGSILALEAIKLIAGIGEPLLGRVLVIDALGARQREVPLRSADVAAGGVDASGAVAGGDGVGDASGAAAGGDGDGDAVAAPVGALSAAGDATVIDVREDWEVADGMIPGAVHVPLADLLSDPGAVRGPVVVVCQAGPRAERAVAALTAAGVGASVLPGGMAAWRGPLVTVAPA